MPIGKRSIKKQKHLPHLELEDDSFDWNDNQHNLVQNIAETSSSVRSLSKIIR